MPLQFVASIYGKERKGPRKFTDGNEFMLPQFQQWLAFQGPGSMGDFRRTGKRNYDSSFFDIKRENDRRQEGNLVEVKQEIVIK